MWLGFWLCAGAWNLWLGTKALLVPGWQAPLSEPATTWWGVLGAGAFYASVPFVDLGGSYAALIPLFAGLKFIAFARIFRRSRFFFVVGSVDLIFGLVFVHYSRTHHPWLYT